MRKLLTTLKGEGPRTKEILDAEAATWGFASWEEFGEAIDAAVKDRADEIDELITFHDFGEVISSVNFR